ncbi:MAG: flavodoxin-dependent (E)-4-hydroxy-3-methylbut-2-enyl-diphosphate synthase [Candidatus Omnitrophica bacterium]|nr:flavodoxin-dependent (E)-4-hydroxy-3-methylbut-2-enyl-diphosphate synthase [Candidatus Omnitrophota bacterium]
MRRKTKRIKVGRLIIGGNTPVAIQSMLKTKTEFVSAALKEIEALDKAGCEILRLAIKDNKDILALKVIRTQTRMPLVADIHFDKNLALGAIEAGADKIRLNPGNIYKKNDIYEIICQAKRRHIPIRVGVNSGSIKSFGSQASRLRQSALLVKSALGYIRILEDFGFCDIVVSLKSSDIFETIKAYQKMAKLCDYPFHLGLTAAGPSRIGTIKSAISLGSLLCEGIGDTIRVSLTDTAAQEIRVAKDILNVLGLRKFSPEIISCPTCGRCRVDLIKIVKELQEKLSTLNFQASTRPMKLALMGCEVNGPGEAKEANIGIAFGKSEGLLFKKGKPVKKVPVEKCVDVLLEELSKIR